MILSFSLHLCFALIFRAEEQSQLQLVEREEIDDEEDLFEAIDKRNDRFSLCRLL